MAMFDLGIGVSRWCRSLVHGKRIHDHCSMKGERRQDRNAGRTSGQAFSSR